jgi:hypothetical protein
MTTPPGFKFANPKDLIPIKPMSYGKPQRIAASQIATEKGKGLRMELSSTSTRFYHDDTVEVGKVEIWAPPSYKAQPEYVTTLDSPEQDWYPRGQDPRTLAEALTKAFDANAKALALKMLGLSGSYELDSTRADHRLALHHAEIALSWDKQKDLS